LADQASLLKLEFMDAGTLALNLSPWARVGIATAPFLVSLAVHLMSGRKRANQMVLMGSATWLAMNVMIAPYVGM
jgi:hypothetical protein